MNWGGGDFQFLKSGSDEPCIQPIESSHLAGCGIAQAGRRGGFPIVGKPRHGKRISKAG
ncbi:hypothetical protein [Bordetella pertussis]|uniref:hypothetical protein n=1 Tax=Bordetella pertussis TaxID=520 RepID=UPI0002E454F5|nr:hypothetical protein [Bordetella pertussis]